MLLRFLFLLFCEKVIHFVEIIVKYYFFVNLVFNCQISVVILKKCQKVRKSIDWKKKCLFCFLKKRTSDYQFFFYYFLVLGYFCNLIWHILSQVVAFLSIELLKNFIFHRYFHHENLVIFSVTIATIPNFQKLGRYIQILYLYASFIFFSIKNNFDLLTDPPLLLNMSKFALFSMFH